MIRIILSGPPGAGKGTQGKRLAAALAVPAISTGDLFRDQVRRRTETGVALEALVAAGDFVPDAITNAMVAERLEQSDAANGFILDGYPRTPDQVVELDRMLAARGVALDAAVLLDVPDDMVATRLAGRAELGRADDTDEVIRHRIALYHRETAPLTVLFDARGLLVRVDGSDLPDVVQARLLAALEPLRRRASTAA
ncbi:adenylate kinase [uncultured Amnibacterium sp.]|uniref:adenylate kinase n=1 Tax=uncultured Amnibacterium sp. TaxID=1631851 RepID=UPI0035CA10B3